ncbi:hypothetical protein D5S17_17385 [Pseudonocardiaceae bacterium YIM PH 21723]|nr:hypothetical protein D5S17_17385 [Pseudonocardiaceae bacterium YIM PH 21723]
MLALAVPASGAAGIDGPARAYGVQYDASHVYVEHGKLPDFIASWEGTFGGTHNPPTVFGITPTPSKALASIIHSPVGLLAAYDYQTPVPFPFGSEQTGFGVHDPDSAVAVARRSGATAPVAPWTGPVGREAVIRFPGGFSSQIWEQFDMFGFPPLTTQPEFRVYLSEDSQSRYGCPWWSATIVSVKRLNSTLNTLCVLVDRSRPTPCDFRWASAQIRREF